MVSGDGDLIIRQQTKGKEPLFVSSYSDFGLSIYSFLAKFLVENGIKFPPIQKRGEAHQRNDVFRREVVDEARMATQKKFPYRFHNQSIDDESHASIGKSGNLEIQVRTRTMDLSPALVKALVEKIPEMYPDSHSYRLLAGLIKRKALRPTKRGGGGFSGGRFESRAFRTKPKGPARGLRKRRRLS